MRMHPLDNVIWNALNRLVDGLDPEWCGSRAGSGTFGRYVVTQGPGCVIVIAESHATARSLLAGRTPSAWQIA